MSELKLRTVTLYKNYFTDFFDKQKQKVKDKILWTFRIIETQQHIPTDYFEHMTGTDGLYEIRVKQGSDIFRIFCFFDEGKLIVLANGFQNRPKRHRNQKLKKH
jgi:putative component of toxin-antitoxin plasmid stabilization module